METKKSKKADLKNKSVLFFEIGMILAIATVLAAFQYQNEDKNYIILPDSYTDLIPDELMPVTRVEPPKPPEPPKVVPIKVFIEVDNKDKVEDPGPIFNSDNDPNIGVVIIPIAEEVPIVEPEYVYFAEKMPTFKGGMTEFIKYLNKELHYPEEASMNNVQGRVFIEFIVNKKGEIEKATVKKGIDPLLDKEALRVVNKMPNWEPGMQNQRNVSVCFTIPINFKLN